ALHAGLRPSVPIDTLHFMRRNQSDQVIVLHDDKAAASGAQQIFIDEVLQVQEALYGSAVTIHEVGNTAPAQQPLMPRRLVATHVAQAARKIRCRGNQTRSLRPSPTGHVYAS